MYIGAEIHTLSPLFKTYCVKKKRFPRHTNIYRHQQQRLIRDCLHVYFVMVCLKVTIKLIVLRN